VSCGVGSSVGSGSSFRSGDGSFVGVGMNSVVSLSRNVETKVSSSRENVASVIGVDGFGNVGIDVDGSGDNGL
jgi:hypothetical protein